MVVIRAIVISVVLMSVVGLDEENESNWRILHYDVITRKHIGSKETVAPRIFGGSAAPEGKFMYLVFLYLDYSLCTGSLIKWIWVMTAAHCFPGFVSPSAKTFAVGGKSDLREYLAQKQKLGFDAIINETQFQLREVKMKEYFIHPKFNPVTLEYDIALVQLKEQMKGFGITLLPLSFKRMRSIMYCTIQGYGKKPLGADEHVLYYLNNQRSGLAPYGCKWPKKPRVVCVSTKKGGTCFGDSGSPLVCQGKAYGVCSHSGVKNDKGNATCGEGLEDYYTELYIALKWMDQVVGGASRNDAGLALALFWLSGFWTTTSALQVHVITILQ